MKLLIEQLPFLESLLSRRLSVDQHKAILGNATRGQVRIIRELFKNIRSKNIIPTDSHLKVLKRNKDTIIYLIEYKGHFKHLRPILVRNSQLIISMVRKILPYLKRQPQLKAKIVENLNG